MAKIMLCDDSKTILAVLERKLREAGHEVVAKGQDGDEGIRLYAERKPDLLLLDITMPNRDGRECLRGILAADPAAKVIMISALKDDSVVQACLDHGAKAFLSKDKLYRDDEFRNDVLPTIERVLRAA